MNPLREEVLRKRLIKVVRKKIPDTQGEQSHQIHNDTIKAICVCKGIPLRIQNDPEKILAEGSQYTENVPQVVRKNEAAIDSELALLLIKNTPKTGFVPNPYFSNDNIDNAKSKEIKYLAVTRIEAPTYQRARAMITDSIITEEKGLIGRAYIDNGGPHKEGNQWLEKVNDLLRKIAFDCSIERSPKLFQQSDRFDAPILYFGWYAGNYNGVFRNPNFCFPVGAIAFHIHSFSASTIRNPKKNWVGPLLEKGATTTLGNVFEPYLKFSHHPHLFLKKLLEGCTLAEAHLYSVPVFSWQSIALGDPLYRPFAKNLENQWKDRDPLKTNEYLVLRMIEKALNRGDNNEAIHLANRHFLKSPGLALGLKRAQIYHQQKKYNEALNAIQFAKHLSYYSPSQIGLGNEIAQLADDLGEFSLALSIYKNLLKQQALTAEMAKDWLPKGILLASRLNQFTLSENWRRKLSLLER